MEQWFLIYGLSVQSQDLNFQAGYGLQNFIFATWKKFRSIWESLKSENLISSDILDYNEKNNFCFSYKILG